MRTGAPALAVLLLLAGCAAAPDPAPPPAQDVDAAAQEAPAPPQEDAAAAPQERQAPEREAVPPPPPPPPPPTAELPLGAVPAWPPLVWQGTCPCLPLAAQLEAEGTAGEWLEVRVLWDGTRVPDVGLAVQGPTGNATLGERGFDERRVQRFAPAAGTWRILLEGAGEVEVRLAFRSLEGPAGPERLPNLVSMRPQGFRVGSCQLTETVEQGARTCLRFGNGIGNTGNGPLQARLTFDQGALGVAGAGRFEQEVLQADGSFASHPVAPARLHLAHSHWHYEGVARFTLHAVDEATGLRGEEVSRHHKAGFCLLDWAKMEAPDVDPGQGGRAAQDCIVPWLDGWSMGITAGWYDFYSAGLADQYVDVEGLADGLYEFVTTADAEGTLAEWDTTDNGASVILRKSGVAWSVEEPRAYYQVADRDQD